MIQVLMDWINVGRQGSAAWPSLAVTLPFRAPLARFLLSHFLG